MYDKTRLVTERDMRDPKFPKDTDPSEYEFRADGCIVRKDRWEVAIRNISAFDGLGLPSDFEIDDLVEKVEIICDFYRQQHQEGNQK